MSGVKGTIKMVGESVGKPIKDELGQVADTVSEQVIGAAPTPTPPPPTDTPNGSAAPTKSPELKKQEDEAKRRNILNFIHQLQTQENQYKQQKQAEAQQMNQVSQEDEEKKKVKKIDTEKKDESLKQQIIQQGMAKIERKKGKF